MTDPEFDAAIREAGLAQLDIARNAGRLEAKLAIIDEAIKRADACIEQLKRQAEFERIKRRVELDIESLAEERH